MHAALAVGGRCDPVRLGGTLSPTALRTRYDFSVREARYIGSIRDCPDHRKAFQVDEAHNRLQTAFSPPKPLNSRPFVIRRGVTTPIGALDR
jgi:hypothetical protein